VELRDFKVLWECINGRMRCHFSDYLDDAPAKVVESVAEVMFRRMKDEEAFYSKDVQDFVTSESFLRRNQLTYIGRFGSISPGPEGDCFDLSESYRRLISMNLVDFDPDLCIRWIPWDEGRYVGHSSTLMKTVTLKDVFDSPECSRELLDYCLYSQIIHIRIGFNVPADERKR